MDISKNTMKTAKLKIQKAGEVAIKAFRVKLWISILFAFCVLYFALPSRVHSAFEQIGAGARPIGMGSAFTAISDDAHAIYYNPSGLGQIYRGEITAGYGKLYAGLKDNSNLGSGFIGLVQPLRSGKLGAIGAGWLSLNLEGAYREDTISLSYGKETFVSGLFIGGTGKVLKRTFGTDIYTQIDPLFTENGFDTTDFSSDIGLLFRPTASYSFGLMFKDITQPDVGLAAEDRVPMEIRAGFGYRQRRLIFDGEISRKESDLIVSLGLEKWFHKYAGLRTGLTAGSRNRREVTAGMSYKGNYFELDYAFIFPLAGIEATAGSHRLGLTVRFGKKHLKSRWEFEEEEALVERLLEEKSAQISAMEKELENLRDQNRSGQLESTWVRSQIRRLEEKLRVQETKEIESMKNRLFESNIETQKMKQKVRELENRIRRLAVPRPVPVPQVTTPPPTPPTPKVPRTYIVQEGETLQSIAEKFYGDSNKWIEIYEANSDRIERGGTIRKGQTLLMPQ